MKGTELGALVEEATVDAYGDEEQRTGLYTMIEEHLDLPFETKVLGTRVMVERVDMNDAGEIVAVCRQGASRQRVPDPRPSPAKPSSSRCPVDRCVSALGTGWGVSAENESPVRRPDWEKVHEVAMALLGLCCRRPEAARMGLAAKFT